MELGSGPKLSFVELLHQDDDWSGSTGAEALAWVRARGFTATDPKQSSPNVIFVTRIGRKVLENGPESLYATERLLCK